MLRNVPVLFAIVILLLLPSLQGCGGSGRRGGAAGAIAGFHLPVAWAERTRGISAPATANSVVIVLRGAGADRSDAAAVLDRTGGASAYIADARCTDRVLTGVRLLKATFHSGGQGSGDVVATCTLSVRLLPDGSLRTADGMEIGAVTNTSEIASVTIPDRQSVKVGEKSDIAVQVKNRDGYFVAVEPGAIRYDVLDGAEHIRVVGGMLEGTSPGVCYVSATVDGVSGQNSIIVSASGAALRKIDLDANGIAYRRADGKLYVAVRGTAAHDGNTVAVVNPVSGVIEKTIPVGSDPHNLALSDDGSVLYASVASDNSIVRVDLGQGAVTAQWSLGSDFSGPIRATALAVSPVDPNEVTVGTSAGQGELRLYRSGVLVGTAAGFEAANLSGIVYLPDGSSVVGGGSAYVVKAPVTSDGFGELSSQFLDIYSAPVLARGGHVYFDNGRVLSSATLEPSGAFQVQGYLRTLALDPDAGMAWGMDDSATVYSFDLNSFAQTGSEPTEYNVYYRFTKLTRWGEKGLAYVAYDDASSRANVYLLDVAPGF